VRNEGVLSEVIRIWVGEEFPSQPGAAEGAAAIAEAAYARGASVKGACDEALRFVGCWMRHPSHAENDRHGLVALAS